jgi:hypothetical protein
MRYSGKEISPTNTSGLHRRKGNFPLVASQTSTARQTSEGSRSNLPKLETTGAKKSAEIVHMEAFSKVI